jgi:hypothetical protein|tara:strand:- start:3462 stop:3938 length:477 start_codon:yes stop_codon:yes gene_type:complete
MHLDKHCVKMILEYSQLLSTAHRVLDGDDYADAHGFYKKTHMNHPSAVWVRKSADNYAWLVQLLSFLCIEYTYRYGKIHKVQDTRLMHKLFLIPNNIGTEPFTEPTPAMPDDCKIINDSIASYRKYYQLYKAHIAKWTDRNMPYWFDKNALQFNNLGV